MGADLREDGDPISEEARARRTMYRFLAAVYLHPPNESMVRETRNRAFVEDLVALFSEQAAIRLKDHAAVVDRNEEMPFLKQEYMDLFVVPTGRYVMPFADVYRGIRRDGRPERGPLLGERAVAVKVAYREAGAQMDAACRELPTHIGVELSFMAFLCEREARMNGERDEAECPVDGQRNAANSNIYRQYQQKFLRDHLNSWFPQLNQAIQEKARSRFYQGLAQLTEDFLMWDMTTLLSPPISSEAVTQDLTISLSRPAT